MRRSLLVSGKVFGVCVMSWVIVAASNSARAADKDPKATGAKPKPTAIVSELKTTIDTKKLLYPAIVVARVDSTVTADLDARVKKIAKSLGSKVRRGEAVLWLENQDPAFTFAAVAVRAPVSGILSQFDVQLMSKVAKGDKLFHVVDPDSLKVEVEVPGSEMGDLQPGVEGIFRWGISNSSERPVKVTGISPVLDARSGTGSAEIEFIATKKKAPSLPSLGSVGQVSFELKRGSVILVPENAISYLDGKPQVRVVDEGKVVHRHAIELGETKDEGVTIRSGLKAGDRIVLRVSRSIKDGEEVEIQDPKDGKDPSPGAAL